MKLAMPQTDDTFQFNRYLFLHNYLLFGYALMGKGFSYIKLPGLPLYIGDIIFIYGIIIMLQNLKFAHKVLILFPSKLLCLFMFWGIIRTVPYFSIYGINAIRDGVIWGYSGFAFIIAIVLIVKPKQLLMLIKKYKFMCICFLIFFPLMNLMFYKIGIRLPFSDFPIYKLKGGDSCVHLSGIIAFVLLNLIRINIWWVLIIFIEVFIVAYNRGGIVAFTISFILLNLLASFNKKRRFITLLICCLLILYVLINPESFGSRITRTQSILTSVETSAEYSKLWRINWWNKIIDYTFYGKYFWSGKGFGINLASDDGFQVIADESLRSPHNGHLTILARTGVPGFIIWVLLQTCWAWKIFECYVSSKRRGYIVWTKLFIFVLVYWVASIINISFDVYLEGPQGGIWFWTIYGVGLACIYIYKKSPQILNEIF